MEDEVVVSIDVFTDMVKYIKRLEKANKALNAQVRKYNKYAREQNKANDVEKH